MAGTSVATTDEAEAAKSDDGKNKDAKKEEEEAEKASSGKILNLIGVDTFRLSEICACAFFLKNFWRDLH